MAEKRQQVKDWIVGFALSAIVILAIVDLFLEEAVPLIVYGLIGGIGGGFSDKIVERLFGESK